jgi:hypothetical protein
MWTRNLGLYAALCALLAWSPLLFPMPAHAQADASSGTTSNELSGQDLSSAQKIAFAEKTSAELDGRVKRILKLIESASKRKDIILLN